MSYSAVQQYDVHKFHKQLVVQCLYIFYARLLNFSTIYPDHLQGGNFCRHVQVFKYSIHVNQT